MGVCVASFRPDGSCLLTGQSGGTQIEWQSLAGWAQDWFAEWRANEHGNASAFIDTACDDAVAGVVDALIVLAETAVGEDELGWVGAGPLEDLVSHSGNGHRVLADVDRAARQNRAFRNALRSTWLGDDVPDVVRERLVVLGATTA